MQRLKSIFYQAHRQYQQFSKEKNTAQLITLLKKLFEFVYLIISLFIGVLYIFTIPFWAPFVFAKEAMMRCYNFTKKVYYLPIQIFKPKLTQAIRYAILKGNGKYLRGDWQDPLLFQLYDYTLRKFMSVQQIANNMLIAQIQCQTLIQWKYFRQNGIKNIKALQSKIQFMKDQIQLYPQIQLVEQNYQKGQFSNQYDCIVAFNIKQKLNKYSNYHIKQNQKSQKIDLIKILQYIKHHLSQNGYIIYGQYFQQQGEIKVMEQLLDVYGLKIQQTQNIQRNIAYANKLTKDKNRNVLQMQLLDKFVNKVKTIFNLKTDYTKGTFIVFILSRKQTQ